MEGRPPPPADPPPDYEVPDARQPTPSPPEPGAPPAARPPSPGNDPPPAFLDNPFDPSAPPAYAPRGADPASRARQPARRMTAQSWKQVAASMAPPVVSRAGFLYWSLACDLAFLLLAGLALLGYSVPQLAFRRYDSPQGAGFVAMWGVCADPAGGAPLKCSFTWNSAAFTALYPSSLLYAMPSLGSFAWFSVVTAVFLTTGFLHDRWAGWISIVAGGVGNFMWLLAFAITTWFVADSARAFESATSSAWIAGFYLAVVATLLAVASLSLKMWSLRWARAGPIGRIGCLIDTMAVGAHRYEPIKGDKPDDASGTPLQELRVTSAADEAAGRGQGAE
ncbi:hypothetical protein DFJ74DRAFT_697360 [Hyaloraphidium curvatum]|nr:hypothetical protein DFJ74DRAFT_697360 [Hyaloraphidium curvatum]